MYDLVVVGGGMAGWTAACRAQELGGRVLLVEAADRTPGWGNGRVSGGVVHAAYLNPLKSPVEILRQIRRLTDGWCRSEIAWAWAANCGRTINWLLGRGASLAKDGDAEYRAYVLGPVRLPEPGLAWEGMGPDQLLLLLHGQFTGQGGEFLPGTRAHELVMLDGRVIGVWVQGKEGQQERVAARAVLIADGGFQGNPALVEKYLGLRPGQMKLRGLDTGRGDGLLMGLAAGANAVGMDRFYGHCLCRDALTNDRLWPYPWVDNLVEASLVVTTVGERVGDEGAGGVALANWIAQSGAPDDCWVIFDHAVWEGPARQFRVPANPNLVREGGTFLTADDLGELAHRAGIDPVGLLRAAAAHNLSCLEGQVTDPPRSGKPWSIVNPPFHAVPLIAGITFTMGGLEVNGHGQVLRENGEIITGLYAAGGAMGGLQGGPKSGYAGGLMEATVFGLLTSEHAMGRGRDPGPIPI